MKFEIFLSKKAFMATKKLFNSLSTYKSNQKGF